MGLAALLAVPGVLPAATCGGRTFCPFELVFREDMALFLEQGLEVTWPGTQHEIGAASGRFGGDVPVTCGLAPSIEPLDADGIAAGCATVPPRLCPGDATPRWQMAVLVRRAFGV